MTNRSFLTRLVINAANGVEQMAARTLETLEADSRPVVSEQISENTGDIDPKVVAVQDAKRAAQRRRDFELAGRLAEVEQYLLEQQRRRDDTLVPAYSDRSAANAKLEDIRKNLLANTPRPDPADRD